MSYQIANSLCEICGKNRPQHTTLEREVCSKKRKEQHKGQKKRKNPTNTYRDDKLEKFLKIYD